MSHRIALAASLGLAITAGLAAALLWTRSRGPSSVDRRDSALGARPGAGATPLSLEPGAEPAAASGSPATALPAEEAPGPSASGAPADSLSELHGELPALERAAWDEIAAVLLDGAASSRLPRVLRSLALELAGTVRTTAKSGPGELTHPAVLSRILEEVLARSGEPLTAAQREQAARLAAQGAADLDHHLAAAGSRPRLASTVAEVDVKLDFVEGLGELLSAPQRAVLDRLVTGSGGDGAPLSPLSLIEAHEIHAGADADAFRRGIAEEFAREFEMDPALAAELAATLHGRLAPLSDGSSSELSLPERALLAARAQAQTFEELLRTPGLSAEARERVLRVHTAAVPRAK